MATFINGVRIDTNKGISSVLNSLIIFSDGSTYDVSSGAFHNKGPGYVLVNGSPLNQDPNSAAEQPSTRPTTKSYDFKATRLELRLNQQYQVSIERHDASGIHAELRGPSAQVDAVEFSDGGGTLIIADSASPSNVGGVSIIGSGNVMISSGSNVSISNLRGGSIVINGGENDTTLKLFVPVHTPVTASISSSDVVIRDVDGPLTAAINGSGDIRSTGATGRIHAQINGSGDIRIAGGSVATLIANINGSGDFKFGGVAEQAMLSINGSGDIKVDRVIAEPIQQRHGSGRIEIKKMG